MNRLLVWLLRGYQLLVSPMLGQNCRFYPTCSNYAIEAVKIHGAARGGADDQQPGVTLLGRFVEGTRRAGALELDGLDCHSLGVEIALELIERSARSVEQVVLDVRFVCVGMGADGRDDQRRAGEASGSERKGDRRTIGGPRVVSDDDRLGHPLLLGST